MCGHIYTAGHKSFVDMILGKSEIQRRVSAEALLDPVDGSGYSGAGYDLRLDRIYLLTSSSRLGVADRQTPDITEESFTVLELAPGDYVLVETLERVSMPTDLMARILPRSTLFRCGMALATAVVDPGFQGTLTLGLKNQSDQAFSIERGARIAQIVFEEVTGSTERYNGSYQGGKVV